MIPRITDVRHPDCKYISQVYACGVFSFFRVYVIIRKHFILLAYISVIVWYKGILGNVISHMDVMKEAMRRVLLFILAAAVMLCHFPAASFASASSEPETI